MDNEVKRYNNNNNRMIHRIIEKTSRGGSHLPLTKEQSSAWEREF